MSYSMNCLQTSLCIFRKKVFFSEIHFLLKIKVSKKSLMMGKCLWQLPCSNNELNVVKSFLLHMNLQGFFREAKQLVYNWVSLKHWKKGKWLKPNSYLNTMRYYVVYFWKKRCSFSSKKLQNMLIWRKKVWRNVSLYFCQPIR